MNELSSAGRRQPCQARLQHANRPEASCRYVHSLAGLSSLQLKAALSIPSYPTIARTDTQLHTALGETCLSLLDPSLRLARSLRRSRTGSIERTMPKQVLCESYKALMSAKAAPRKALAAGGALLILSSFSRPFASLDYFAIYSSPFTNLSRQFESLTAIAE